MTQNRLLVAVIALAVWLFITVFWGSWEPHENQSLAAGVSGSIAWTIAAAAAFLVVVILVFRWRDIGFVAPHSLHILWFPIVYIALLAGFATLSGWPPMPTIAFLAVNSLLVGLSEELAFRGVLFRALLTRLPIWPAIWTTSAAFGAVHILNGLGTGDWFSAFVQATAAAMSGLVFLAIVIRTGSIIPAILVHASWDFTTLCSAIHASHATAPTDPSVFTVLTPILFELPHFLYGLYLLRDVGKAQQSAPIPAAA